MNRRRLVQTVMAMLAGASLHGGTANAQSRPSGPSTGHCLVIGAGLAGLAAASGLRAKGHAVTVLEARERIGGRIWTSDRWPDMPLDLGASWIHGTTDNPLTALADRIGAQRISTTYDASRLWNTRGQPLTDNEIESLDTLLESFEAAVEAAQDGEQDVSIRAVAERMITRAGDDASFRRRLGFIVNSTLEQEYAGSAAELSTYWHDHHEGFDGEDVLFAQGFQVIPNHLAEGIVVNKGCIVREIHWGRSPVRVVTDTAVFEGSRVLVTLPLGVLKSGDVRFVPELPKDKRLAIRHLGMGVLNKCYLRFDRVYWPKDVDWLEIIPERHGEWTEWVSFARAAQWPVLLGFNAADHGRDIEAQGDEAIVDSAMTVLRRLFGTSLPEPIDHQISRWASDPFARGSYSFNALGSHPAMRGTLSRPLGQRLFFAGEATEADHFGTAHGAVLSGYRAAAQMSATTK